jgi:hypothetical protein
MDFRLLAEFQAIFQGKEYRHRRSSQGDRVAQYLYEDLFTMGKSKHFVAGVTSHDKVLNSQNKTRGIKARRGDGTFGERVTTAAPIVDPGFNVARGMIATVEIGIEAKFLQKAMIKQVDRVMGDMKRQLDQFHKAAGNPICIGLVGINWADYTIGYEKDRSYRTDGKGNAHPVQEAAETERRMREELEAKFDALIFLRYKATNESPFPFEWKDLIGTQHDYSAILIRLSREYDTRFGAQ